MNHLHLDCKIKHATFALNTTAQIATQGITAIFGPSGAGKSSLLRLIAGLDYVAGNQITFNQTAWQTPTAYIPTHKRRIGYVFQDARLFSHLSILDNIAYGYKLTCTQLPTNTQAITPETAAELLGINTPLNRSIQGLSGGEQKRVAIARALAANPQLLLLDEPLSGLDETAKQPILAHLSKLGQQLALPMIYVSHSLPELMQLADWLVLLQNGQIQAQGKLADVLTNPNFSLAHTAQAQSCIHTHIKNFDTQTGLLHVDFAGGTLAIPALSAPTQNNLRLSIAAKNIRLYLTPPTPTQSTNKLANSAIKEPQYFLATIAHIQQTSNQLVVLQLAIGQHKLVAHTTRYLAKQLTLTGSYAVLGRNYHSSLAGINSNHKKTRKLSSRVLSNE